MPAQDPTTMAAVTLTDFGNRTDYKAGVATALPQSTTGDLFTVTGIVAVKLILGEVSGTAIQAQGDTTKLIAHPATGTDVDLCGTLDITGLEIGAKVTPIGTVATALQKGNAGAVQGQNVVPLIVGNTTYATTIRLSCLASNTGAMKWYCFWMPLTDGANVVSA